MFSGIFDLPWWGLALAALGLTHVTIAAVTIFLHRHQAHRALDLGPLPSHFFRFWLWLTTGMITREWAAIHRKHHAKCESPDDPHSPRILGLPRVLFGGVFLYVRESHKRETLERYGHGTPDDWLERHVYTPWHKVGIVLMLAIDGALFGLLPGGLIWGVQMVWIPFWAAGVINGVGHFWGYRNFACADASTNILPWGILIGGEELHNNHHAYASSARLSNRWYEVDIGWCYIRLLALLGQARVRKVAPRLRLGEIKPAPDRESLEAVITHRYDVLARYLKSLRRLAAEELRELRMGFREARAIGRLLALEATALGPAQRERLAAILTRSQRQAVGYAMRGELEALWARSTATHDQLVARLQDWVARAEASGIRQLEEFALRLRRCASA
ncbi:MAG: fatty acid desaturase [Sterolibacteriaceae bacterium MAG5]|nr:fatty acid desaturase [Candidatus Nitricoxidireducens bremensis]